MKIRQILSQCIFLFVVLLLFPLFAQDAQYIGGAKCKMCHRAGSRGNQWEKWLNGPHIKAYETLASDQSKKIANAMGIDDPLKAEKCLKCHVTAFHAPAAKKAETYTMEEGVGCEACHGPGSLYKSLSVMKGLHDGTKNAADYEFLHGDEETCLSCHNEESPTYRPFNYEEKLKIIAHPIPAKQ